MHKLDPLKNTKWIANWINYIYTRILWLYKIKTDINKTFAFKCIPCAKDIYSKGLRNTPFLTQTKLWNYLEKK